MADIFISYAREDREWVEKLASALTGEGYTVWWDWDLLVGKRYRETIETELQTCKATVVVWSNNSTRSDFVRDEAEEGQQRNILVPILKDSIRPPAGFRQLQTADLTQWNGAPDHVEFRRMLRGLEHMIGRSAKSTQLEPEPVVVTPEATLPQAAPAEPPAAAVTPGPADERPAPEPAPAPVAAAVESAAAASASVAARVAETPQPKPVGPIPTPKSGIPPTLPSPFANMKVPPGTHPIWRYVAIGGVAFVALIYVAMQLSPSTPPAHLATPKPLSETPTTPTTPSTPTNADSSTEGRQGGDHGTPSTPPANTNTATTGNAATDLSSATSDVSAAIQKAEAADRDARTEAAQALVMQKAAASGAATAGADGMAVGTLALANGSYAGQVYNGIAQGLGGLTFTNGDLYAGQFDEGVISGRGVVTFSNKTTGLGFSGQFAAGTYNGYGVYYLANGWRVEGFWHNGQLQGYGAKIDPSGKIAEQGNYDNGVLKQ